MSKKSSLLPEPNTTIKLNDFDPDDHAGMTKEEARVELRELRERLASLQEKLHAESKQSLLIVLQAMDTGGKDGTIEHVFEGVNPQGVNVASFKAPTPDELAHDFLWRVHR